MAGYIGSKTSVTQVDGYNRTEADAEFVSKDGDTITTAGTALTLDRTGSDGTIIDVQKDGTSVGSIGVLGANEFYIDGPSNSSGIGFLPDRIAPRNSGIGYEDATQDIGQFNIRFKDLYLSGGVYLGGTGSANKLSSYETGTWTPTLTFNAANPTGLTYNSITSGTYTKVGRKVTVFGRVMLTSKGTGGSGGLHVSSLPFVPGPQWSGLQIGFIRNTSTGLYQKNLYFTVDPSNTNSPFRFLDSSGGFGSVSWADITNTFDVIFSGSYEV